MSLEEIQALLARQNEHTEVLERHGRSLTLVHTKLDLIIAMLGELTKPSGGTQS